MRCAERHLGLTVYKFREHFVGIDRNEGSAAAGQHFALLVQDFCLVNMPPASYLVLTRLDPQRLIQRHGLHIVNRDL